MPIYEYQCAACGHTLEVMQKISEGPLKKCPECSKESLQKLISAAGFQLKGTGWYATDFRNKGKPEAKNPVQTENKNSSETPSDSTTGSTGKEGKS
ncbi:MAG TPA: zinc ribbon domain-containing protein [Gammaproteobacteria bacterium]|nr:zinc ribbon domain-containing protein [Gammaproteobacteria bacterium]